MTPDVLTVGALTARVAAVLRSDPLLAECQVRGELSNWKRHSSGHCYFTLKDAVSQVNCVMFRGDADRLRFAPGDGLAVVAAGRIDVYEPRGQYQLYVRALHHDGLGALYEAYERLRARLEAEGLFDEQRKQPLPAWPRRVAVITSLRGAAVRDMVRILRQRWPAVEVILAEALVQGPEAAASLVRALDRVQRLGSVDVILIGRGGGSLEDLWAFNEEPLVRAVAACPVPVISAVGHETDFTLCDFVADVRAATPTHAAQLAVPDVVAVARQTDQLAVRLAGALRRGVETARWRWEAMAGRRLWTAPQALFEPRAQRIDELAERSERAAAARVREAARWLAGAGQTLSALDPTAVLGRGYAIVTRQADGHVALAPADLPPGTPATVRLAGGTVAVTAD